MIFFLCKLTPKIVNFLFVILLGTVLLFFTEDNRLNNNGNVRQEETFWTLRTLLFLSKFLTIYKVVQNFFPEKKNMPYSFAEMTSKDFEIFNEYFVNWILPLWKLFS